MNDYLLAIYAIVTFQSLFLSTLFLVNKTKQLPNRILGVLMFVMGIPFAGALLSYLVFHDEGNLNRFTRLFIPFLFAYSPLLTLYTNSLIRKIHRIEKRHILLFLPFAAVVIITIVLNSSMISGTWVRSILPGTSLTMSELVLIQGGILYLIITLWTLLAALVRYKDSLRDYFSNTQAIGLTWLRNLLALAGVTAAVHFAVNMADLVIADSNTELFAALEIIAGSFGFLCILFIAWSTLTRPEIFTLIDVYDSLLKEGPRYEKQRLDPETELKLLNELETYMDLKKPYLNNDLTLRNLAEGTGIPSHQITMILNLHRRQNYYSFVNSYRIDEACNRLVSAGSTGSVTILDIAMDTGFNSKSTFNTLFKRITGFTPREYRARHSAVI